ncbi:MAG: hypothetical protein AAF108_01930 [Planctomycetota bacterium]
MSDSQVNPLFSASADDAGAMSLAASGQPIAPGQVNGGGVRGGVFTPSLASLETDEDVAVAGELPSAGRGKRYAVIAGVLALGVGVLMVMRHIGSGPREAIANVKIDYAFAEQQQKEAAENQRSAIEELERTGPPVQLPVAAIERNPFLLSVSQSETATGSGGSGSSSRRDRVGENIKSELDSLRLQAVIDGRVPVARISGKTCRLGDRVGQHFTVESIGGHEVVLRSKLGMHELLMGGYDE